VGKGKEKTRNALKYLVRWEVSKLAQPRKKAFRVNRTYPKILRNRKRRIERRLDPERRWTDTEAPMMSASNIHFEMAERSQALNYGGIGAMHLMGQKLGLAEEIDARLQLLKRHLPYHESDHVLNLAYNSLLDGLRLQDIELRRNDEAFLDGLELNAFLIQQPAEILRGASIKSQLRRLWKRSMLRASGFGKSSLGVFCRTPLLIQTARWLRRLESAKEAWGFPTKASGVMRP